MQLTASLSALSAALGFAAGAWISGLQHDVAISKGAVEKAESVMAVAEAASLALYDSQQRSDRLTRDLAQARTTQNQITQELHDAIELATAGRVCLDERALRVLDGAPGLAPATLPPPGSSTDGADAAHAATDTDVGHWALAAGDRYAECVRRYNALIDWHGEPQQ